MYCAPQLSRPLRTFLEEFATYADGCGREEEGTWEWVRLTWGMGGGGRFAAGEEWGLGEGEGGNEGTGRVKLYRVCPFHHPSYSFIYIDKLSLLMLYCKSCVLFLWERSNFGAR